MERRTLLGRLSWQLGEVVATEQETARAKSITLALPNWRGQRASQHVDVRLTAEDGYQTERSYSIASPPEEAPRVTLTIERIDDGEVSPYLTEDLRVGDKLELRGPVGGYFVWEAHMGGPLLLVAGGSGIVPLMAMIRHRAAVGSTVATRLLSSSRSLEDVIYRAELDRLVGSSTMLEMALIPDGSPGAGGSVVLVQKWLYDAAAFDALPIAEQEKAIGRTKETSSELAEEGR